LSIHFLSFFTTEAQRTQPGSVAAKENHPLPALPLQGRERGGISKMGWEMVQDWVFPLVVNFLFYRKISCLTRTIPSPFKLYLEEQIKNDSPSIPIDYANILIPLQKPCCKKNSCKIVRENLHSY
jgi:hypothetical protein